ncbi:eukaryotic peptide chain release factor subunit 1-like [Lingula anatina]|uniref:Eukaryotic peptide chain release factor subunit 1-like n=1 Tax=Lingula anatina TaxID=7574 RepID=A0A1S3I7A8_LINAN|nr:eukaryotic peptide chain release factor subunit 1-like [Lingula anatina]|eukprot:XP_013394137.1 eukaryotic peptide chain release factor subunit 1-like [Lingula anatina]
MCYPQLGHTIESLLLKTGVELELSDSQPLLEWLANNYKTFGATLEIITDRSQEGAQFVKGFGGIGGKHLKGFNATHLETSFA